MYREDDALFEDAGRTFSGPRNCTWFLKSCLLRKTPSSKTMAKKQFLLPRIARIVYVSRTGLLLVIHDGILFTVPCAAIKFLQSLFG